MGKRPAPRSARIRRRREQPRRQAFFRRGSVDRHANARAFPAAYGGRAAPRSRPAPWPSRNKYNGRAAESRRFGPPGRAEAHRVGSAAHRRRLSRGQSPHSDKCNFTLVHPVARRASTARGRRLLSRNDSHESCTNAHFCASDAPGLSRPRGGLSRRAIFGECAGRDRANSPSNSRAGAARLPPGVTATRSLELPPGARLIGAAGGSTLKLIGPGPLLHATGSAASRSNP